ncbi:MAG TPA: endolytic transglycosylase MltG, partial [Acidimicrobiaceae bacterium]|nr:endolytic transglycosylase MltG [Acidimicrobiaceae bacterium]
EILPRLADPDTGVERWSLEALQAALDSGEIRSQYQPEGVTSYEGLLFPDTYEIDEDVDEAGFLRRLVAETDARLTALDVEARAAALGRTPYEILVIASLIEEETRVPAERAMVARVVYNRLEQGIPLGIDATSRYEAEISGRDREDLDFESDSPYNTRRVAGIPPTPIAAPGQASLEGALNPAEGNWIYYVLQDEQGNHFFTDSFAEFNEAKAECARLDLGCG